MNALLCGLQPAAGQLVQPELLHAFPGDYVRQSRLIQASDGLGSVLSSNTVLRVHFDPLAQARVGIVRLLALVDAKLAKGQPLRATLSAALASVQRGNTAAALHQLEAFQNQVRAQVAPSSPALAQTLISAAQDIINELTTPKL